MEAAIRFSQNSVASTNQRFLYVDVVGKSFKVCQITSQEKGRVSYDTICSSSKAPPFRAFDWHPLNEDLVVVGQAGGEATLLNVAEGQQDSLSFQVRSQRLCNAVALNTTNLLAAGLDRVRTDFCLNIWDFNQRLPAPGSKGFSKNYSEPLHKLAAGEPITSIKFFQDDPQLLIAGVKGQFIRLYDLREPGTGTGLQFATRCVHNLTVDWRDENYFASCYPTNDPSICLWDRRMISRSTTGSLTFGGVSEPKQPEISLELKNAVDSPGVIWSLRFSKSKPGCLGALSSTGHLRVFEFGTGFVADNDQKGQSHEGQVVWENRAAQEVFLNRAQDIERHFSHPSALKDERSRIVSFDFTTAQTKLREPEIMTLDGHGEIRITSTTPSPEPGSFSSVGFLLKGRSALQQSFSPNAEVGEVISVIKRQAEPRNALRQAYKHSKSSKSTDMRKMSSVANQAWFADLGFFEKDVPLSDLLALTSIGRLRCLAGYLFNPTKNKSVVSDSHWLQSFWAWIERAARISRHGNMTQDNLDLAYIGVFGLWMEDINQKNRTLGPCSSRASKIIENLVRRLHIPPRKGSPTEYPANRQLCLHVSGQAWSSEELEVWTRRLVGQGQHTKAAALAIFADDRKLAYKVLRVKSATQAHKMLAMAIAGGAKRTTSDEGDEKIDGDGDWIETISSLVDELTDPYARAILAFVKSGDYADVVAEESLPLKYRVGVALRHFDDSKLTKYISQATKDAVTQGDVEGVILTGTATKEAFELLSNYIARFNDLQTAVLALCGTIPRYIDDEKTMRKFNAWKQEYRAMMNSWDLKFDRVRFDIASQRLAVDSNGRRLIEPAKPQVKLVCSFCTGSLAYNESNGENSHFNAGDNHPHAQAQPPTPTHSLHDTAKNPLVPAHAAAQGTVCPKCGRHLPRCGVCDLWLGTPDETYLKWYGSSQHQNGNAKTKGINGDVDLSVSMTGSIQTTIGPSSGTGKESRPKPGVDSPKPKYNKSIGGEAMSREGSHGSRRSAGGVNASSNANLHGTSLLSSAVAVAAKDLEESNKREDDSAEGELSKELEHEREIDIKMARFIVFCVKCSHGFHAAHARVWFQGTHEHGRVKEGHRVCPVPKCECICYG